MPRGPGHHGPGHHGPGFRPMFHPRPFAGPMHRPHIHPHPVARAVHHVVHPHPRPVVPIPVVVPGPTVVVTPGATAVGPLINPSVPINTPIHGTYHSGKIIYISGMARPGGSRFTVNLACGPSDNADLALHFDARFNFGSDHNVVVRNHRYGGNYGSEEKHQTHFPFIQGVQFEMMILAEPHCFKVAVNNQHFLEFNHRIQPLESISYLQVKGDLNVSQIRFQ